MEKIVFNTQSLNSYLKNRMDSRLRLRNYEISDKIKDAFHRQFKLSFIDYKDIKIFSGEKSIVDLGQKKTIMAKFIIYEIQFKGDFDSLFYTLKYNSSTRDIKIISELFEDDSDPDNIITSFHVQYEVDKDNINTDFQYLEARAIEFNRELEEFLAKY